MILRAASCLRPVQNMRPLGPGCEIFRLAFTRFTAYEHPRSAANSQRSALPPSDSANERTGVQHSLAFVMRGMRSVQEYWPARLSPDDILGEWSLLGIGQPRLQCRSQFRHKVIVHPIHHFFHTKVRSAPKSVDLIVAPNCCSRDICAV